MRQCIRWVLPGAAVLLGGCLFGPATPWVHYGCQSGAVIDARYPEADRAVLVFESRAYTLRRASSSIGRLYKDNHLQWRVDGQGRNAPATLFTPGAENEPGEVVERCREARRG